MVKEGSPESRLGHYDDELLGSVEHFSLVEVCGSDIKPTYIVFKNEKLPDDQIKSVSLLVKEKATSQLFSTGLRENSSERELTIVNSSNVFLQNGKEVEKDTKVELKDGDVFNAGTLLLIVRVIPNLEDEVRVTTLPRYKVMPDATNIAHILNTSLILSARSSLLVEASMQDAVEPVNG